MKKVLLLVVLLSYCALANAQTPADRPKGNAKITGTVMDTDSNTPVEFANVALLDPTTGKPVDGAVCDDKGVFTINRVAEGTYNVSVTFIGYETQTVNGVKVGKKDDVSLGVIKLGTGAKVLNEVVVEGQKQMIEERVDRTIYNAENDATTRGGDATDVLKRVPMLSVDLDGNVSMRGSSNVTVLINNKPSTIMASSIADALKQIPADQIKTVEVITSPSAKYDAEGSAGIINIVTKKNTLEGLTLNVDAGVGTRGSNLGLNGNYRKGKMGFSLGGWGRSNYNVNGRFESNQISYANFDALEAGTPILNHQDAKTRNNGIFGNYTLGWDYDINDKNFVTASVRFGARNGKNYQDDLLTMIDNGISPTSTLQNVATKDLSNTVDASLTYTHLYQKPQKEFSLMGSYSRNNRNNNFDRYTYLRNDVPVFEGVRNLNDSYNQEVTIQADFQNPIGTNQMIEMGAKDIMRKAFSDYAYYSDLNGDGIYEEAANTTLSNNLNYDQNVASGYLSYTYTTKSNYSFKGGARYEYTTINAYTRTEDNIDIPSYGALVPSVNVSRKFKNGRTVKAAYNRRIQRPSIRYLNPNVQGGNPYDVTIGNPSLDPEYTNNYELTYSTFIKGTSLNFSGFWRNTNNAIQEIRTVEVTPDNQQRVTTTYNNIGQEDALGVNIFANVNVGKLSLNGGTDLYYSILDNNIPINSEDLKDPNRQYSAHNEGWVASYRLFGSYTLGKGWAAQFFGFYRGRQIQLQGTQGGFGIYSLGFKKDIADKKGSVGFGAENFFTSAFNIRGELVSPLVQRNNLTVLHNMSFRVNFSYRIGKMSVDAKPKRRRSISNDDLKEGGDGGQDGGQGGGGAQGGGGGQRGGGAPGGARPAGAAATAAALPPANPTATVKAEGTWNYTIDSPQGGEGVITITKEGEKYSANVFNKRFNSTTPVSNVKVNGNEVTLEYEAKGQGGNAMPIQIKGIIAGDDLTGNIAVGQFGVFPLKATRAQ